MIVGGGLNVDLDMTGRRGRDEEIVTEVVTVGLEEPLVHFLPLRRRWSRDWITWKMVKQGKKMWPRKDYILGSDHHIFQNMAVQDLRHNSNHYMVMGCLRVTSPREHSH